MHITYVPLLGEIRRIYQLPRSMRRFAEYLKTMKDDSGDDVEFPPLVMINPMAREHVLAMVETLIALDADRIAEEVMAEVAAVLTDVPDSFSGSLVVLDDLKGGWTNRYSYELDLRRIFPPRDLSARQARRFWVTGVLWSSESPSVESVREAASAAAYRTYYVVKHGGAKTLGDLLKQEGWVMTKSQCRLPSLDGEELAWTQEVVDSCRHCDDIPTLIECLCGDEAAATLGYGGKGLLPWAGLRLALGSATADSRSASGSGR